MVYISIGFQKKLFRVKIPPETRDGTKLRLSGLGQKTSAGQTGDLYLKVEIKS